MRPFAAASHIRVAMLLGATLREVLEICVQATAYVGVPTTVQVVRVVKRVAEEQGRKSSCRRPIRAGRARPARPRAGPEA